MRNSIPERARAARAAKIVATVAATPMFAAARQVALFWPMLDRAEIDVRPLDQLAREQGKVVAYPFLPEIEPPSTEDPAPGTLAPPSDAPQARPALEDMTLLVAHPSDLGERGHGFAEPPPDAPPVANGSDLLIIVPALAVAPSGHRIGYGRGYYDRLLTRMAPPAFALAVAYDFDVLAEVPVTEGDYPVDMVVTDARSFRIARV